MRIVRYRDEHGAAWGAVRGQEVYALEGAPFGEALPGIGARVGPLGSLSLLAPATPSKVICVGRNYAAHAAELGNEPPDEPLFFFKPPSSLIGPGATIELPAMSERVDHEGELALVIGRRARHLRSEDAMSVVFGYTCANDVTARDIQRREKQWARAKGFDTFCPVGPWIVTADEFDPASVRVQVRVDGDLRQDGRTDLLIFDLPRLLTELSAVMTLEPGDLLLTGTPAGVGPLADGQQVEVSIEGIGTLRNPVAAP